MIHAIAMQKIIKNTSKAKKTTDNLQFIEFIFRALVSILQRKITNTVLIWRYVDMCFDIWLDKLNPLQEIKWLSKEIPVKTRRFLQKWLAAHYYPIKSANPPDWWNNSINGLQLLDDAENDKRKTQCKFRNPTSSFTGW